MHAYEEARAKVNLALHVVGRRADGYHLLDMLVAFPAIGDRLTACPAAGLTLRVIGPEAGALLGLEDRDNLVLRAANALADHLERLGRPRPGAHLLLEKHLPTAAGLGGGSADAAAALRLLNRIWSADLTDAALIGIAAGLGADVPMCVVSKPLRATGIGHELSRIASLPPLGILLANPRQGVSTPAVFRGMSRRDWPQLALSGDLGRQDDFLANLINSRNDMQATAEGLEPAVTKVMARLLGLPGVRFARMSGSGATCFAIFDDLEKASEAAAHLDEIEPGWWLRAASLV